MSVSAAMTTNSHAALSNRIEETVTLDPVVPRGSRRRSPKTLIVRFAYRPPLTPARVARRLRAASLEDSVAGRVIVVTGASSGIGRAVAMRLGAAGATVLLVARTAEALERVREQIDARGGTAHPHPCDLRNPDAIDQLAAEILDRHGHVAVLINNAGHSIRRPIHESYSRLHDYQRTMALNYHAPLRLTLALLPTMREYRSGHIINISTMGVQVNPARFSAYIASKAALDAFSKCLATEACSDGIRVTTIHPPLVHTPMTAPSPIYDNAPGLSADEAADMIIEAIRTRPARIAPRFGRAVEIARLIAPNAVQATLNAAYRRSLPTSPPPGEASALAARSEPAIDVQRRPAPQHQPASKLQIAAANPSTPPPAAT
jgi:NAD(P)-dependent dehydrogenase (short-subunit alcohol dehydrogenase family)